MKTSSGKLPFPKDSCTGSDVSSAYRQRQCVKSGGGLRAIGIQHLDLAIQRVKHVCSRVVVGIGEDDLIAVANRARMKLPFAFT